MRWFEPSHPSFFFMFVLAHEPTLRSLYFYRKDEFKMGGKRVKSEPIWNVFLEDFNRKEIVIYNVFHSHTFLEQVKKEFRRYSKHKDIEKLEREIRSWAMYCFWSKCEYEIIITSFPERKEFKAAKVDVYRQLELNWKPFFNYIYDNKAYFLRRENK